MTWPITKNSQIMKTCLYTTLREAILLKAGNLPALDLVKGGGVCGLFWIRPRQAKLRNGAPRKACQWFRYTTLQQSQPWCGS